MRRRLILALPARAAVTLPPGHVLRGRFVQERHLTGFNAPLRATGSFLLAPGKGLIWRAEAPFAITTVITAAGLVQEIGGAETLRLPAARIPFLARLYTMLSGALSGDWSLLEPDFIVTRSGDDAAWRAVLAPRQADAAGLPFRVITVSGGRFVEQVRLDKPEGDFEHLAFLDQTLSAAPLQSAEAAALRAPSR